jgi:hypothetical protein
MTTRHPRIEDTQNVGRFTQGGALREIEPKVALEDEWLARLEGDAEKALHHRPQNDPDFDIAAWFALDDDEQAHAPCMTECWYG